MQNIGVFTALPIDVDELTAFVEDRSRALGQSFGVRDGTMYVGHGAVVLYVRWFDRSQDFFYDDAGRHKVERHLGTAIANYVDIHFTSRETAYVLAVRMAHEVQRRWNGAIDYSGAGGGIEEPPMPVGPGGPGAE